MSIRLSSPGGQPLLVVAAGGLSLAMGQGLGSSQLHLVLFPGV